MGLVVLIKVDGIRLVLFVSFVNYIRQGHLENELPTKESRFVHSTVTERSLQRRKLQQEHHSTDRRLSSRHTSILQSPLTPAPLDIFLKPSPSLAATYIDKMHQQHAPAIVPKVSAPAKPRCSERERKATARFAQGWCALHLPSLSLALGVGAVRGPRNDYGTTTEGELPPNDDTSCAALGFEAWDEVPALGFPDEEDQTFYPIGAMEEPRRSERERQATKRFEEGWFSERLPRLSSALGMAVTDRKVR